MPGRSPQAPPTQPVPALLDASVIVTTYNNPHYLELVLAGYARQQTTGAFEVIVADDGSRNETRELIDHVRAAGYPVPLVHAWQPDEGFRQARAMSLGALRSGGRQLIFTDGDCVPPKDMVQRHLDAAGHHRLVVGGHIRLAQDVSDQLTVEDVHDGAHEQLITTADRRNMLWKHYKNLFYVALRSRRRPKIFGLNMGIDRDGFYAVNGFDLAYENNARQDSDLRNRARLAGFGARCIWHTCIAVHLWHPEHKGRNAWSEADAYYRRADLEPWAQRGIRELAAEYEALPGTPSGRP